MIIVGDNTDEALPVLANRLLEQQRSRDPRFKVVTNKSIELKRPYVCSNWTALSREGPDGVLFHRAGQSG